MADDATGTIESTTTTTASGANGTAMTRAGSAPAGGDPPAAPPESSAPSAAPPADWRASLPEDLRKEKALEGVKDIAGLAKAFVDTKRLTGAKFTPPTAETKAEDAQKWRDAVGVPRDVKDYALTPPGEGPWDDRLVADFKQFAWKHGIPASQAQALMAHYAEVEAARLEAKSKGYADAVAELEREMGTPKYNRAITLAYRAIKEFGGDEAVEWFDKTREGDNPTLLRMFAKMGEAMAEDRMIDGRVDGVIDRQAARDRIAAIRADQNHPFNHPGARGYAAAQAEVEGLYKLLYGTGEVSPA